MTKPSLFEFWLHYTWEHHCYKGLAAREFLLKQLKAAKKIPSNRALWNAASEEIKAAFRQQFGTPQTTPEVRVIEDKIAKLKSALSYANEADRQTADVLRTRIAELRVKVEAKQPKCYPWPRSVGGNRIFWRPEKKRAAK